MSITEKATNVASIIVAIAVQALLLAVVFI